MGDIPSNNKFHGEHDEHTINVDGTVYLPFSFRPKVSICAPNGRRWSVRPWGIPEVLLIENGSSHYGSWDWWKINMPAALTFNLADVAWQCIP